MEHHWNDNRHQNTKIYGEEPVPMSLCPPPITVSHILPSHQIGLMQWETRSIPSKFLEEYIYIYICVKLSSLPQFLNINFSDSSFDCIAWCVIIIGKNVDGIFCDTLGEVPFGQLSTETEQTPKGLKQHNQYLCWGLNLGPPKCESRMQ